MDVQQSHCSMLSIELYQDVIQGDSCPSVQNQIEQITHEGYIDMKYLNIYESDDFQSKWLNAKRQHYTTTNNTLNEVEMH